MTKVEKERITMTKVERKENDKGRERKKRMTKAEKERIRMTKAEKERIKMKIYQINKYIICFVFDNKHLQPSLIFASLTSATVAQYGMPTNVRPGLKCLKLTSHSSSL
jgi:hypothetical protein